MIRQPRQKKCDCHVQLVSTSTVRTELASCCLFVFCLFVVVGFLGVWAGFWGLFFVWGGYFCGVFLWVFWVCFF